MKKTKLTLFIILSSFVLCFSQKADKIEEIRPIKDRKNELKIGVIKLLAVPTIDFEYERLLNKYSSIGGNVILSLDKTVTINDFVVSPYYRMYFTEKKEYGTKGFFGQAYLSYINGTNAMYNDSVTEIIENKFNTLNIGFGLGKKWQNKQGFVFQFVVGVARAIVEDDFASEITVQGDFHVGYRF